MTDSATLRFDFSFSDRQQTSPRMAALRSGANWPAMAGVVSVLAEIAGRVNGLGASFMQDAISQEDARALAAEVLTALDDAMATVVEAAGLEGHTDTSLFAESADLLTDLCVMGTWTLQRKRAELEAATFGGDAGRTVDACESARRGVLRAFGAIERALLPAGITGAVARLMEHETERALSTRAIYRAFRTAVRPEATPNATTIEARLTAVGVALARVFASPSYRDLRASDRRIFREIEQRLTAFWSSARTPLVGLRLFQDIAAFAGCLRAINHRSELLEHDGRTAATALSSIGDGESLEDSVLEAMGALLGCDDELDEMLLGRRPAKIESVRAMLEVLARQARS